MSLRVLIVDDSDHFLETAGWALQREGLEVVATAHTSAEALSEATARGPDVVLVDIGLGEESGFELARQLADGPWRVILVSTDAEEDYVELIEASTALGFLGKSNLSAKAIRRLLRRSDRAA